MVPIICKAGVVIRDEQREHCVFIMPLKLSKGSVGEVGMQPLYICVCAQVESICLLRGEDDCPCGRKGKYFKVFGRLKDAEVRGCSDTYAEKFK